MIRFSFELRDDRPQTTFALRGLLHIHHCFGYQGNITFHFEENSGDSKFYIHRSFGIIFKHEKHRPVYTGRVHTLNQSELDYEFFVNARRVIDRELDVYMKKFR